jgi:N-acetylneuraminic acid mutarotase
VNASKLIITFLVSFIILTSCLYAGWTIKNSAPIAIEYASSGIINNEIYIAGGTSNGSTALSVCYKYNPVNNQWTQKGSMSTARMALGTGNSAVGNKLEAIAGINSAGQEDRRVEEFDVGSNNWISKTSMPAPNGHCSWFATATVNDKVYCIGNHFQLMSSYYFYGTTTEFDPAGNTWTVKALMPTARGIACAAVYNGEIYVFGGYSQSGYLNVVEKYNPATNAWTSGLESMPTSRACARAVVLNGKIYVIGGYNSSTIFNIVEIYDPVTNSWTTGEPMNFARAGHMAEVVNGKIYVVGGNSQSGILSSVEEFSSSTPPQYNVTIETGPFFQDDIFPRNETDSLVLKINVTNNSTNRITNIRIRGLNDVQNLVFSLGSRDANNDGALDYLDVGESYSDIIAKMWIPRIWESKTICFQVYEIEGNSVNFLFSKNVSIYYTNGSLHNNAYRVRRDGYQFPNWGFTFQEFYEMINEFLGPLPNVNVLGPWSLISTALGHCFGMSGTSIVYFRDPSSAPYPNLTINLPFDELVRDAITLYHTYQVCSEGFIGSIINPPVNPNSIEGKIINYLKQNKPFIINLKEHSGAWLKTNHAVTGYKLIQDYRESNSLIYLYDNIYPGIQKNMGWSWYSTQVQYSGYDFISIEEAMRLPFETELRNRLNQGLILINHLLSTHYLNSGKTLISNGCPVKMLLTDEYNRRIGYVNGTTFVNEIPNASVNFIDNGDGDSSAFYEVPNNLNYSINYFGTDTGHMITEIMKPLSENSNIILGYDNIPLTSTTKITSAFDSTHDYNLYVDIDGNGTTDTIIPPTYSNVPPCPITLLQPVNNIEIFDTFPTFVWNKSFDLDGDSIFYRVYLSTDTSFSSVESSLVLTDTIWSSTSLIPNISYYWKVKVWDTMENESWSVYPYWKFSIINNRWHQKESMPSIVASKYVKDGGALVAVDSNLFAFRGNKSKELYKFIASEDTWAMMESIPYGKKLADTTKINKKKIGKGASLCYDKDLCTIYATKGNGTYEFWAYDAYADIWTTKAFVPARKGLKGGTSVVYSNGKVFLLAGSQKPYYNNFFVYDITSNTWDSLRSIPLTPDWKIFKDGSCLTIINDTIYALKGGGKHNYFWAYNIDGDTWVTKETIPLIHPMLGKKNKVGDGGAMTTDGSIIYAIKGKGKQDFWSYTPTAKGTWTPLDTIPRLHKKSVPKTGASLAYANGVVYLLKGNKTPEFWQYIPEAMSKVKSQMSKLNTQGDFTSTMYQFLLYQNKPNPFKSQTNIRYSIPNQGKVTLSIYDVSGRLVKTLVDEHKKPGIYSTNWNGTDKQGKKVSQGVYFYVLKTDNNKMQKKMLMLK